MEKKSNIDSKTLEEKAFKKLIERKDDLLAEHRGLYIFQNALTLFEHLLIGSTNYQAGILDKNTPMTIMVGGDIKKTNETRRHYFETNNDFFIQVDNPNENFHYEIVIKLKNSEQATTLDNIDWGRITFSNSITTENIDISDTEKRRIIEDYFAERESRWDESKQINTPRFLNYENNS